MTVEERVIDVLENFKWNGTKAVSLETPLKEFIEDSLDSVELLIELEGEFEIEIEDGADEAWIDMNVSDLVDFIRGRIEKEAR
jgi:acyl carrier protein